MFWFYIGLTHLICFILGMILVQILWLRDFKKVSSSVEAALKTVEYHKNNEDIAY